MSGNMENIQEHSSESSSSQEGNVELRSKPAKGFTRHLSLLRGESMSSMFKRQLKSQSSNASVSTNASVASRGSFYPHSESERSTSEISYVKQSSHKGWSTIIVIVLVEAKGLPDPPNDGNNHNIYCKFQLGSESHKSKSTPNSRNPKWGERFKMRLHMNQLLKISLWDKGKQKNFMGSCCLDLSNLERERTNEVWQSLDDGFGSIHLSVTMCTIRNAPNPAPERPFDDARDRYAWHNFKSDGNRVGQMHVKVIAAKGLSGRPQAYSVLELDNERVQTHNFRSSSEPVWNKSYMFNVYDMTSTLDVKVYDSSIFNDGLLGKVSIPLLKIKNGGMNWFALKDKTKRNSAKGNCPRVLLDITIFWNPVKSALRLFQPKEVKYVKKPTKFDIGLVYSNIELIKELFDLLYDVNEHFKRLFEWDNRELSFVALMIWLFFWYHFEIWMGPLMLLLPFLYFIVFKRSDDSTAPTFIYYHKNKENTSNKLEERTLTGRIQDLPEMTLVITNGIECIVSAIERLYNLASFKIPFLSYVAIIMLMMTSLTLYLLPFNYLLMGFGIYKFSRRYVNPGRTLNNDLLDFISRIPDNEMLKDWKPLSVPEPAIYPKTCLSRSFSN